MFDFVISRQGKPCDFTALDPTCVKVPPIRLVLLEPYKLQPAIFPLSRHVIRFHELPADTTCFLQQGGWYYA